MLKPKTVKNILDGSLRAMLHAARTVDGLIERDPLVDIEWPRIVTPPANPFEADERDAILDWMKHRRFTFFTKPPMVRPHPPYHAFLHLLFWTGMRPSEAEALDWEHIDLRRELAIVRQAQSLGEINPTKTVSSDRAVELHPETVRLLSEMQPLRVHPRMPVFTDTKGGRITFDNSLADHWNACLRALKIQPRGVYACKDTFCSHMLSNGVDPLWMEKQTGVSWSTLRKHYARWITRRDGRSNFALADPSLCIDDGSSRLEKGNFSTKFSTKG